MFCFEEIHFKPIEIRKPSNNLSGLQVDGREHHARRHRGRVCGSSAVMRWRARRLARPLATPSARIWPIATRTDGPSKPSRPSQAKKVK